VASNTVGLLNITAKLKNSFLLKQKEDEENDCISKNKEFYNHMLVGRIKDTNNMFSFIL